MNAALRIDLDAPEGNAFVLMAYANDVARLSGYDSIERATLRGRLDSATSYREFLDRLDAEFPGVFEFVNDPREQEQTR